MWRQQLTLVTRTNEGNYVGAPLSEGRTLRLILQGLAKLYQSMFASESIVHFYQPTMEAWRRSSTLRSHWGACCGSSSHLSHAPTRATISGHPCVRAARVASSCRAWQNWIKACLGATKYTYPNIDDSLLSTQTFRLGSDREHCAATAGGAVWQHLTLVTRARQRRQ